MEHDGFSRWKKEADNFYVAYSSTLNVIKFGVSKNPSKRMSLFNYRKPGNTNDFILIGETSLGSAAAGEFETLVSRRLSHLNRYYNYHDDRGGYCRELYVLDKESAKSKIDQLLREEGHQPLKKGKSSSRYSDKNFTCSEIHIKTYTAGGALKPLAYYLFNNYEVLPSIEACDLEGVYYPTI
ncbi:hypothetical protein R7E32_24105 [Vibrio sp. Vb2130]|nr:hypothetical protein [Vibrio sp. Vb2130]